MKNSPPAVSAAATFRAASGNDGARPTNSRIRIAPAPFPAQSHATSMTDLAERLAESASGV